MKCNHTIKAVALGLLALGLWACQRDEKDQEARAVATSETYLAFAAKDAPGQTISVYADGSWAADTGEDWISVNPMSGNGPAEVTISVADNYTGPVMDLPRTGTVLFQGGTALRRGEVTIAQAGDLYKGVQELTVTEVLGLDDEAVAKIPSGTVAAVTRSGFVLTDGTSFLYAQGMHAVAVGDAVSLNGAKATFHGAPSFLVDELTVTSSGTFTYPEAPDLSSVLGSYDGKSVVFGSLSGSLINGALKTGSLTVIVVDPAEALEIGQVDLHKVVLTGYAAGREGSAGYMVVTAIRDEGLDDTLVPYPLRWAMGKDLNYSSGTFNTDNPRIDPVQGIGYIEYIPYDLESTNSANSYRLDVQAGNPRVIGPWVNDCWLFYGNGAIAAGTEVQIAFEMRSSAWGMKFWLLEYLDGDEWLTAGTPQVSTEPGYEVPYHVATNADGATNSQVMETIRFRKNNDHLQIRLRCSALWRGGGGYTSSRSTASSRLTVTDVDDDTYKPNILILKEGDGVEKDPVYARIETSADLLTFNGTPSGPKILTVTSDHAFTVSTAYDWLSLSVGEGAVGETVEIEVTCAESELSELREGTIRIVSEDSGKVVHVVQSAAGQMLDPFISISSGNAVNVGSASGEVTVRVQTNTEVDCASDASWISVTPAGSKALVEWKEYRLAYEANEDGAERTGTVRFFNTAANQEAVVTLRQAAASASVPATVFPVVWSFPEPGDSWVDGVDWHCENPTGSYVCSDTHEGKMSVVRFGGAPDSVPTYKTDTPLGTRLLHYGVYKDDYWLFEVENVEHAAGTYTIGYGACSSAAGPKFFALEYSLDNGSTWTGINTRTTSEAWTDGTNARDVTYTYALSYTSNTANEVYTVTESFHLDAFRGKLMIRARVSDTMRLGRTNEMSGPAHGGTNRIGNTARILFSAD